MPLLVLAGCTPEIVGERPSQRIAREAKSVASDLSVIESFASKETEIHLNWNPPTEKQIASMTLIAFADEACQVPIEFSVPISLTDSSTQFTPPAEGTYTFKIRSKLSSGKTLQSACSNPVRVDWTPPTPAEVLGFKETSPSKESTVHAQYRLPKKNELIQASLQLFSDGSCFQAEGAPQTLDLNAEELALDLKDGEVRSYKVTVYDQALNESVSACAGPITGDQSPPLAPTALQFAEGLTSSSSSVTATWAKSKSSDVAVVTLAFYDNATCAGATSSGVDVGLTDEAKSLSVAPGSTHSFQIFLSDTAGNLTYSECSSAITIETLTLDSDTTSPAAPTALTFSETSPSNASSVTASWTPSSSSDVVSQSLQAYSDAGCSTAAGAAQTLSAAATTATLSGLVHGNVRAYKVTATDGAGNSVTSSCSSSITIDKGAPIAPSALTFTQTSPSNASSVTASWTLSTSTDVVSQSFQAYSDAGCSTTVGAAQTLSASATSATLSGLVDGNVRAYKVTATDGAGNSATAGCSSAITIDRGAPAAPTSLSFVQTSPSNASSVTASWTISTSTDVVSQSLQAYSDAGCSTTVGAAQTLSALATSATLSGLGDGNVRAYKVTATDGAGNSVTSSCSSSITIDKGAPTAPTALTFTQTSPSNASSVTASWTLSTSTDVVSQSLQAYSDAGCNTSIGAAQTLSASATTATLSGLVDGNVRAYKVTATDGAGNAATSSCSSSITIDQSPPAKPTQITRQYQNSFQKTGLTQPYLTIFPVPPGHVAKIYTDSNCSTLIGTSAVQAPTPPWYGLGVAPSAPLSDGPKTIYADVTDPAGNRSPCSTTKAAFTVETTPVPAPTNFTWWVPGPGSSYQKGVYFYWNSSSVFENKTGNAYDNGQIFQQYKLYSGANCQAANLLSTSTPTNPANNQVYGDPILSAGSYSVGITSYRDNGDSNQFCSSVVTLGSNPKLVINSISPNTPDYPSTESTFSITAFTQDAASNLIPWLDRQVRVRLYSDSYCTTEVTTAPDGSSALIGSTTTTSDYGRSSFSVQIHRAGSLYLRAEATGLAPSKCAGMDVASGSISAVTTAGDGQFSNIGVPFENQISLSAKDQYQNPISGSVLSQQIEGGGLSGLGDSMPEGAGSLYEANLTPLDGGRFRIRVTLTTPLSQTEKIFTLYGVDPNAPMIMDSLVGKDPGFRPSDFQWILHFSGGVLNPNDITPALFVNDCSPSEESCPISTTFKVTELPGDLNHSDYRLEVQGISTLGQAVFVHPKLIGAAQILSSNNLPYPDTRFTRITYEGETVSDFTSHTFACACDEALTNQFGHGDGHGQDAPGEICSIPQLQYFSEGFSATTGSPGFVVLCKDLDLTGVSWTPMPFTGEFNGNGYSIAHLSIHDEQMEEIALGVKSNNPVKGGGFGNGGFFSSVGPNTKISRLRLLNARVAGDEQTGVLMAGIEQGGSDPNITLDSILIENALVSGLQKVGGFTSGSTGTLTIVGSAFSGRVYSNEVAGGLIGSTSNDTGGYPRIHATSFNGDIFSLGVAGGLVGNSNQIEIAHSVVMGDWISGRDFSGGLVGTLDSFVPSSITHSAVYTSEVESTDKGSAGGFIGALRAGGPENLNLASLISAPGRLTAGDPHPFFTGAKFDNNSFTASGGPLLALLAPPKGGEGYYELVSVDDLKTFDDHWHPPFDFDSFWVYAASDPYLPIPRGVTLLDSPTVTIRELHPTLCRGTAENPGGDGSRLHPYELFTVEQLKAIQDLGAAYALCASLDLDQEADFGIGDSSNPFTGVFDGNGFVVDRLHSISDLGVNKPAGFFRFTDKALIKNLILRGPVLRGDGVGGAITGIATNPRLLNVHVNDLDASGSNSSTGLDLAAGLIGVVEHSNGALTFTPSITRSSASGVLSSSGPAGGLVGKLIGHRSEPTASSTPTSFTISDSAFLGGAIQGLYAGGLLGGAGDDQVSISRSRSYADVSSSFRSGGVVGIAEHIFLELFQIEVYGSVTTTGLGHIDAGGMVGLFNPGGLSQNQLKMGSLIGALSELRAREPTHVEPESPPSVRHTSYLVNEFQDLTDYFTKTGFIHFITDSGSASDTSAAQLTLTNWSAIEAYRNALTSWLPDTPTAATLEYYMAGNGVGYSAPPLTGSPPNPSGPVYPAVCSCLDNHNTARSGDSAQDPYEICSQSDFDAFRFLSKSNSFVNKFVTQCSDIDLSNYGANELISSAEHPFSGTFSGNSYKFTHLNITIASNQGSSGLFFAVENATLKGITLINPTITSSSNPTVSGSYGALAGYATTSQIIDCRVVNATISLPYFDRVGGLIGKLVSSTILRSRVSGIVDGHSVGGLVGLANEGPSTIDQSGFVGGTIQSNHLAGGLIGQNGGTNLTINLALVMADSITASSLLGGINVGNSIAGGMIGYHHYGVQGTWTNIQRSAIHVGSMVSTSDSNGSGRLGGVIGDSSGSGVAGITTLDTIYAGFNSVSFNGTYSVIHPITPYISNAMGWGWFTFANGDTKIEWPIEVQDSSTPFHLITHDQMTDAQWFSTAPGFSTYWIMQDQVSGQKRPVPAPFNDFTGPF